MNKQNDNKVSPQSQNADISELERAFMQLIVAAREESGMTQAQLSELSGLKQSVIARIEKSTHSPQIRSIIKVLQPLGYTLAVVKK